VKRLGLGVGTLRSVELGEIVQQRCGRGMLGPQLHLADAQRALLLSDLQPALADLSLAGSDLDSGQIMAAQAFRAQAVLGRPMPNAPTPERDLLRRELAQMQLQVLRGEASPAEAVSEADQHLREQLGTAPP